MAYTEAWNEDAAIQTTITAGFVVAVALSDAQARPLLTYDQVGRLDEQEAMALAMAVTRGLNVVSPTMWRCNIDKWRKRLQVGANHPTNIADMMAMAESGEPLYDLGTRQWRPDRYFGAPLCELTDGQVLAYDAAQLAYKETIPKAKEKQWPKQNIPKSPR